MAKIRGPTQNERVQLRHLRFLRTWAHRMEIGISVDTRKLYKDVGRAFSDETLSQLASDFLAQILVPQIQARYDKAAASDEYLPEEGEGMGAFRGSDALSYAELESQQTNPDGSTKTLDQFINDARNRAKLNEDDSGASDSFMNRNVANVRRGFSDLRERVFTIHRVPGGAGIGRWSDIKTLKLSDYAMRMAGRGRSRYNRLFYAVEFGTGIAEKVGGSQFVRREGATKDRFQPGAWWLGPEEGQGIKYLGQKAFHFLYEPRRDREKRVPRDEYKQILLANFATFARMWYARNFRVT